ncbi:hypothetical protein K502DRAFT_327589 [Neoconidiobolus thromboides FSU 785]|nr:hypothetical protein K502DRAFT_327589 [Neoconidiobolus thromboides FSU 785]
MPSTTHITPSAAIAVEQMKTNDTKDDFEDKSVLSNDFNKSSGLPSNNLTALKISNVFDDNLNNKNSKNNLNESPVLHKHDYTESDNTSESNTDNDDLLRHGNKHNLNQHYSHTEKENNPLLNDRILSKEHEVLGNPAFESRDQESFRTEPALFNNRHRDILPLREEHEPFVQKEKDNSLLNNQTPYKEPGILKKPVFEHRDQGTLSTEPALFDNSHNNILPLREGYLPLVDKERENSPVLNDQIPFKEHETLRKSPFEPRDQEIFSTEPALFNNKHNDTLPLGEEYEPLVYEERETYLNLNKTPSKESELLEKSVFEPRDQESLGIEPTFLNNGLDDKLSLGEEYEPFVHKDTQKPLAAPIKLDISPNSSVSNSINNNERLFASEAIATPSISDAHSKLNDPFFDSNISKPKDLDSNVNDTATDYNKLEELPGSFPADKVEEIDLSSFENEHNRNKSDLAYESALHSIKNNDEGEKEEILTNETHNPLMDSIEPQFNKDPIKDDFGFGELYDENSLVSTEKDQTKFNEFVNKEDHLLHDNKLDKQDRNYNTNVLDQNEAPYSPPSTPLNNDISTHDKFYSKSDNHRHNITDSKYNTLEEKDKQPESKTLTDISKPSTINHDNETSKLDKTSTTLKSDENKMETGSKDRTLSESSYDPKKIEGKSILNNHTSSESRASNEYEDKLENTIISKKSSEHSSTHPAYSSDEIEGASKSKGYAKVIKGSIKKTIGKLIKSESLIESGTSSKLEGKAVIEAANAEQSGGL